jgi:hypothetical protein
MARFACAVCAILSVIFVTLAFAPVRYAATARVLLPEAHSDIGLFVVKAAGFDMSVSGEPGSRVLEIGHWDREPHAAAQAVNEFLRTHLTAGMTVIDEAAVPYRPVGPDKQARLGFGFLAVLFLAGMLFRKKSKPNPDRSLVRHALRFARHGEQTVLVETQGRLVLSHASSPEYRILARLLGGALIVARLESRSVAVPRRRAWVR